MSKTENKLIVMFADVSGSARLFKRLGDAEAAHAVERCVKRMERSIIGYRGQTLSIVGGELVATFRSAEDACHASVNMQLRVSKLPPVSSLKLTIRIGLHFGTIVADGATVTGDGVTGAKQIAGLARIDQILASSLLIAELPKRTAILSRPMPDLGVVQANDMAFSLAEVDWMSHEEPQQKHAVMIDPTPSQGLADLDRLCVRYRGNAFQLDENSPFLTLGRDQTSRLVIVDRKASRAHARIERRNESYYYIDSSTNGSYVTLGDGKEIVVRRSQIQLKTNGRICFGASSKDPNADFAEFEIF